VLRSEPDQATSFKSEWLRVHLKCPACAASDFDEALTCANCGWAPPVIEGTPNFITEDMAHDFRVVETDNVSDHAYSPSVIEILDKVAQGGGMALDCGAGSRSYMSENLVQTEIKAYPNVDILAVNQLLPFVDDCFDAVFSLDVLEHVTDPFAAARELARVLRPGGILFINLPFLQVEHGYPHHYFNATRMGLRQLFNGLLKPEVHGVPGGGHAATTMMTMIRVYRAGLPKALRAEFDKLPIGYFAEVPWVEFRDGPFGKITDEIMWKMASTTQAIFSKPGERILDIEPAQLATFARRPHVIG
jgi:SAM-dependent methyltransferase